jgi:hypothetical protein
VRGRPVFGGPVRPPTIKTIDQYCTLAKYDWQAYVELLRQIFTFTPCLLCGQLHALKIRSFLVRKVRSPEDGCNTLIIIILIFCQTAKEQGKQYTKRLLPPFVIPYCVICRETVLAYVRLHPDGAIHAAVASLMMGTVDIRTMRRHVRLAMHLIKDAALNLWEFMSELPVYTTLPDHRPGASPLESLDKAAQELDRAAARVQGGSAAAIPVLVYVHALNVYARANHPIVPVSTLVLRAVFFHDTS